MLVLLASCLPGAHAPKVAPTRTLNLEGELPGAASAKAFGVVFAGPKGKTVDPGEVTIVFNRPMRPLDLAGSEGASPAILRAGGGTPVKGEWRWLGTSALAFSPTTQLPRATEYAVTVPAGTKALDGSVLRDTYAFTFSTPPPKVVRVQPDGQAAQHLTAGQTFELRFNQPVDPKEVERAATLFVGDDRGKKAAFRATHSKEGTPTLIKLTPLAPLPLASAVFLHLDRSLHGLEGPLPVGEVEDVAMRTYGPLEVRTLNCYRETPHKKCAAKDSLDVELSNRISEKEWRAHARIDGAELRWQTDAADTQLSEYMRLSPKLRSARSYRLVVSAGLKDEFGQVLTRDAVLPFETDDEWPAIEVGLTGTVFEAGKTHIHEVPIASVNVASYELVSAALDETNVASFVAGRKAGSRGSTDELAKLVHARSETVRSTTAINVQSVKKVSLDAVLAGRKGRGVVAFAVRAPVRSETHEETRVVSLTDLAITAKMSRFGSVVWVTRLSDGKPVPGAIVSVRNAGGEIFTTKVDASGVAIISIDKYNPVKESGSTDEDAIVVARMGDDWSFREVSEILSPWRYQPSSDPAGRLTPFGMLFTDRGIYKPGETIRVKGLFRRPLPRGTETPAGREVKFEAFDSQQGKLLVQTVRLGAFGEFAVDLPVPASTPLGGVELRAAMEDGPDPWRAGTANAYVQLAAYRPAEFKVSVDPDKPAYIRGDKATFVARGDYLFGAPMSGGSVRFTATRGPSAFAPPGTDGLLVDDNACSSDLPDASERAGELESGKGALSERGDFQGTVSLALPHQHGTEAVSIEAEVEDVSRQTIAGRSTAIVHPGEFYVALKPPKEMFVEKTAALAVEVAAVEPSGKKRVSVPITVELVRRTWNTVARASGEYGMRYESKPVDTTVATCTAKSTAMLAYCTLPLSTAGYFVLRATAKDPRGNAVASSTSLYVLGEGDSIGWRSGDDSKIELVTDKKFYEVGDTATVLVKNPFREAEALVTVERAGVYRQEKQLLTGPMPTLRIPITDDLRPNAFVSVHLVRGRTKEASATGADIGAPVFRLGYASLVVNPEARRLKVAVTPTKKDFRPGEDIDVDIAVTDRAGKGARSDIAFYAVDEGVLMLTGYKTPDPIPVFTAPRPLAVFSLESREDLAKTFLTSLGSGGDKGGIGGGGGGAAREDFRSTAFFQPSILAPDGKAHVHFRLPDSLTTYRLMAVVAAEDDRFGFGGTQVVASRRLMARPALPRFLRAGDSIEAGVVLSSKGLGATTVEVTLAADGATVIGEAKKNVALPANGSLEVRWQIASPNAGKVKFSIRAHAGAESDVVEVTREVMVPSSPEAVALYGETDRTAGEQLGDLSAMRTDTGGLDLRLSSTALVGLDDGVEQLLQYPYGCTEQLASRLVPLVALRDLAADFRIKLPANLDPVIDDAIAKIIRNQHGDGSFGYWPDSPSGNAWVTVYALWTLDMAKKHGHHVPDGAIERATRSARKSLNVGPSLPRDLAVSAFIVDVLAEVGSPDPGFMNRLYEKRADLPLFARALLSHAMSISKTNAKESAELLRDLDNHLRVTPTGATVVENLGDEYAVLLDSEARTTAMAMRALVAGVGRDAAPNPLAARLAKGLLSMRHGGTWRSTQETAWALLALDDYRRSNEKNAPDFDARVFLGDEALMSAAFHERTVLAKTASFPAEKIFHAGGQPLAFQVQGTGKLFYEARLRYSRRELPTAGLDRGFFVRKFVRSVKPEALRDALASLPQASASTAKASDLVLVDLLVVNADPRENVVVDDPLPAGLEAVQSSLTTTARSLAVTDAGGDGDASDEEASGDDERANGRAYTFAWYHREFHDDRVLSFVEHMPAGIFHYRYLARATTFGHFVVPPTRVECMYEPEIFGRTGASTFDVR